MSHDQADGTALNVPGVVPKLSATPWDFAGGGPAPGEHTDAVLRHLSIDEMAIAALRSRGVVG